MQKRLTALGEDLKRRLSLAGDLIILNILFILCCIPVFTVGAAEVACYSSIFRILRGERVGMSFAGFFRDFAANFKKAALGWLIELLFLLILAGDLWFAVVYSEPNNTFFLIFAIVFASGILLADIWLYPLIARYENKLGAHIKNSFLMVFAHFPKTLLVLLIRAAILTVPFLIPEAFANFGWFWLLFGASLPIYLTARLLGSTLQCEPKITDTNEKKKAYTN
jgi:Predicted integral membrane protein